MVALEYQYWFRSPFSSCLSITQAHVQAQAWEGSMALLGLMSFSSSAPAATPTW
jgi:hypothetical protein